MLGIECASNWERGGGGMDWRKGRGGGMVVREKNIFTRLRLTRKKWEWCRMGVVLTINYTHHQNHETGLKKLKCVYIYQPTVKHRSQDICQYHYSSNALPYQIQIWNVWITNHNTSKYTRTHSLPTCSTSSLLAQPTTFIPCFNNLIAVAFPIPVDTPVINATFPAHLSMVISCSDFTVVSYALSVCCIHRYYYDLLTNHCW